MEKYIEELLNDGNLLVNESLFDDICEILDDRDIKYFFGRHDENNMYFELPGLPFGKK